MVGPLCPKILKFFGVLCLISKPFYAAEASFLLWGPRGSLEIPAVASPIFRLCIAA